MKNRKYLIVFFIVLLTLTSITFGEKMIVAYFDFTANSFNELFKGVFPEMVDAQFKGYVVDHGQYTLVTRDSETLAALLSENELEESGLVLPSTIHQLQLLGISYEMIFDFINAESGSENGSSQYSVSFTANGYFRAVSTTTGEIVAATSLNVEDVGYGPSEGEALDDAETIVAQGMAQRMYIELTKFALINAVIEKQISSNEFLINKGTADGVSDGIQFNFYNTLYGVPILSGSAKVVDVGSTASIIQVITPPSTTVYIGITGVREISPSPSKAFSGTTNITSSKASSKAATNFFVSALAFINSLSERNLTNIITYIIVISVIVYDVITSIFK